MLADNNTAQNYPNSAVLTYRRDRLFYCIAIALAVILFIVLQIQLVRSQGFFSVAMSLLLVICLSIMLHTAWRAWRGCVRTLQLDKENQVLSEQVTENQAALHDLDTRLQLVQAQQQKTEQALHEARQTLEQQIQSRTLELDHEIGERKSYAERMYSLANYDSLTQLPNRNLLEELLQHAIDNASRSATELAVLVIDIINFKRVNDSFGYVGGDVLLQAISERLKDSARHGDILGRLDGNRFAVLLEGLDDAVEQATGAAQAILKTLAADFHLLGREIFIEGCIGISIYPQDGGSAHALLKNANTASNRLKTAGQSGLRFYTKAMTESITENMTLEAELRRALERDELCLHYQPQVNLTSGKIIGFEALLRWQHPQRGLLMPDTLIPLASNANMISEIDTWVLKTACAQIRQWQQNSAQTLCIAVNLSAQQLLQDGFPEIVADILSQAHLPSSCIELELTESMLMQDVEQTVRVLQQLRDMQVRVSVDDFGTGYSSLSYLKRFPVHQLKIDRSFVRDITTDPNDAAIVAAVIELAHQLELEVVAEGIESDNQLTFLQDRQCDVAQGFYISEPLCAEDASAWLHNPSNINQPFFSSERTVLIVDDDAIIVELLSEFLTQDGFRVFTAESAEASFDCLARQRIDVVISDYDMPGMHGIEFLSRVRTIYPKTVRIMLSAFADTQILADAINEGAIFQFLFKPVSEKRLRDALRDAIITQLESVSLCDYKKLSKPVALSKPAPRPLMFEFV